MLLLSQCHFSPLGIRTPRPAPTPVSPQLPARSPRSPPPLSAQSSPPSLSLPFTWAAPDLHWRSQGGLPKDCRNEAGTRCPPTRRHWERHPLHARVPPSWAHPCRTPYHAGMKSSDDSSAFATDCMLLVDGNASCSRIFSNR